MESIQGYGHHILDGMRYCPGTMVPHAYRDGEAHLHTRRWVVTLSLFALGLFGPVVYISGVVLRDQALLNLPVQRLAIIYAALGLCAAAGAVVALAPGSLTRRGAAGLFVILNLTSVVLVGARWTGQIDEASDKIATPQFAPGRVGILVSPASDAPEALAQARQLEHALVSSLSKEGLELYVHVRQVFPISSEAQARRVAADKLAHIVLWQEERTSAGQIGVQHITVLGANETDLTIEPLSLMLFMSTQDSLAIRAAPPGQAGDGSTMAMAQSLAVGFAGLAVGRPKLAGKYINGLIKTGAVPSDTLATLHSHLGTVYLYLERPDLALGAYERSIEIQPNAKAWTGIGNTRLALRDWQGASAAYRSAALLDPYDPMPYCGLGVVHARWREVGQAIAVHEQAISLDPDQGVPYALLGLDHELLGDIEAAQKAYVQCAHYAGPNAGLSVAALDRAEHIVRYPPTPVPTATPPPLPTPTPVPISAMYTVERGDTLQVIAAKYEVTVDEIVELNELNNPNAIRIGQTLMIPSKAKKR